MNKFNIFFTTYLFLSALVITNTSLAREKIEKTVALVSNEVVLESDFAALKKKLSQPGMIDEALITEGDLEKMKDDRRLQLDYLINEKLMDAEIKRLNLKATDDRVDQEIRELAKRNNIKVDDLYEAVKQSQGMSRSEYREFRKSKIERQTLIESEIISKLRISDEDALSEYLKNNPSKKSTSNEFTVAHILFNIKKRGLEKTKERAQTVLAKLKKGEKFDSLAEQYSEDPNFSAGGLLGTFRSGEVLPEIERSIQNLSPGQTSDIVSSKLGLHIVKLLDKKTSNDPHFEKVKEQIKSVLLEEAFKKQLRRWLLMKKEDSFINING